jgi:hypothetical protein
MEEQPKCLYCGQDSHQIPLVNIFYQDKSYWICPQHFPFLIHNPAKLEGKLPGIEKWVPFEEPEHHH